MQGIFQQLSTLGTSFLRFLPPETSHNIGMWLLKKRFFEPLLTFDLLPLSNGLKSSVPGIGELPHPIGLAAGFDKNCECPLSLARLGFSFLEIGTVTPLAQPGNPKPRIFRYKTERSIINRMGFNNDGAAQIGERLRQLNWKHHLKPLGINVGKNKLTPPERAIDDYIRVMEIFRNLAKFFVINISSPNTPGLRDLANPDFIRKLAKDCPVDLMNVWIKLDPDMEKAEFQEIISQIAESGFQGVVLTNTHRVNWPEEGGQSGHPLAIQSTACLEWAFEVHKGKLPMIASGGVLSGADILQKLARGASAVEVYTGLIYHGPLVVKILLRQLLAEMKLRGFTAVEEIIGSHYG